MRCGCRRSRCHTCFRGKGRGPCRPCPSLRITNTHTQKALAAESLLGLHGRNVLPGCPWLQGRMGDRHRVFMFGCDLSPWSEAHCHPERNQSPISRKGRESQQTKRRPSELVSRVCPALPSPLPGPGPHRLSAEVPQSLPGRHFGPSLSAQPPEPARDRRGHSVCSHPLPKPRVASRGL